MTITWLRSKFGTLLAKRSSSLSGTHFTAELTAAALFTILRILCLLRIWTAGAKALLIIAGQHVVHSSLSSFSETNSTRSKIERCKRPKVRNTLRDTACNFTRLLRWWARMWTTFSWKWQRRLSSETARKISKCRHQVATNHLSCHRRYKLRRRSQQAHLPNVVDCSLGVS